MSVMTCFVFMSVILGYNFVSGSYYQPNPTDQSSTVKHPAGQCVVQQICHGGPSPEAFSELASLVKEMKKKLEVMESKLDAVCDGKCHSKRDPKDCAELYKSGKTASGVYTIHPDNSTAFEVYCDQTTDGGGWTVFQKRLNGSVDFYRDWKEYKNGFGRVDGEFWLGLDDIHRLTSQSCNVLRVDLEDFSQGTAYAAYDRFVVEDESKNYKLNLGVYSGTAGDSLSIGNGMAFSTKDRDNDVWPSDCAVEHRAAWWYRACHKSNLNGMYFHGAYTGRLSSRYAHGCVWQTWHGYFYSLKTVTMKFRPINF